LALDPNRTVLCWLGLFDNHPQGVAGTAAVVSDLHIRHYFV
jgi:hypothetical protein